MILALPDGGRLAYEVTGEGPPLLLCRWGAGGLAMWRPFAARFAARRRVIAFDPRGTGASSDAPLGTTTRALAADARALLDALDVERADVLGESLGGMTASWLAIDAPARVRRLVLVSTLPEVAVVRPRAIARALSFTRCFTRAANETMACLVRTITPAEVRDADPARMAAIEEALRRSPMTRKNLAALGLAAVRHRAGPALRDARAPTLLLFGALDPLIGHAAREAIARDRPGAEVEVLPDAGHALTLERPDEVAARSFAFFER